MNKSLRGMWSGMLQRCTNKKNSAYRHYGARGIAVCERWLSFENFVADMGPRPEGTTLDRINNDAGYEPLNCRWATHHQQARNRRSTVMVTYNGITQAVTDWASATGLNRTTIRKRLLAGWTPERALTVRDTRGIHRRGGTRPESVRKKISEGLKRAARK